MADTGDDDGKKSSASKDKSTPWSRASRVNEDDLVAVDEDDDNEDGEDGRIVDDWCNSSSVSI